MARTWCVSVDGVVCANSLFNARPSLHARHRCGAGRYAFGVLNPTISDMYACGFRRAFVHKRSDSRMAQTQGVVGILLTSPLATGRSRSLRCPMCSPARRDTSRNCSLEARCAQRCTLYTVASKVERTTAGGAERSWSTSGRAFLSFHLSSGELRDHHHRHLRPRQAAKRNAHGRDGLETASRKIRRIDLSHFAQRKTEIADQLWDAAVDVGFSRS